MRELCVIGWPVEHSRSPLLHNTMLDYLGLGGDYRYTAVPVPPDGLAAFLDHPPFPPSGLAGFNVTMPHKSALLPHLDGLDPLAEKLGAVNTVCIKNDKLYGYNTDCPGFVAALHSISFDPSGARVLLLGGGGAAAAVAAGLCGAGARRLYIANRTPEKAARIAALCPGQGEAVSWTPASLAERCRECDLLVNATSLGMAGSPRFETLDFLRAFPPHAPVCDLIYHPAETELLREARALGHPTMNGLPLLIHQAILALEHFLDRPLPRADLARLLERTLAS